MKTHELKLDFKYFDDVISGKKNFIICKNDRDFQACDILELKAWDSSLWQYAFKKKDGNWYSYGGLADTIKVCVTTLVEADRFNKIAEIENGKQQKTVNMQKEIKHDFSTYTLPDDYVVLGIVVAK